MNREKMIGVLSEMVKISGSIDKVYLSLMAIEDVKDSEEVIENIKQKSYMEFVERLDDLITHMNGRL